MRIGLSREWLSKLKSQFERGGHDPRSLEPLSRSPRYTGSRQRITKETENKIIEIRDQCGWGKEPISAALGRDYKMQASPSTVNRYLRRHKKICPKLSERNKKAWTEKQQRETLGENQPLLVKHRPPSQIKDYAPGALLEKDMKLIPTKGKIPLKSDGKYHLKDCFNYQHSLIDSFTRIKVMELVKTPDSQSAAASYRFMRNRLPFAIAGLNTDDGGENGKDFKERLAKDEVIQFFSRTSTPTDNPRVERSHLTDDRECRGRGNNYLPLEEQKQALKKWEYIYNYVRPHRALGYLTPMEFYRLWQENPEEAYKIKDRYQTYLARQRKRLANSRRIKSKE